MLITCDKCGETTERYRPHDPCHLCACRFLERCIGEDASAEEIADASGWTIDTVRRWLRVFGLKARRPGGFRKMEPREVEEVTAEDAQTLLFWTIVRTVKDFLLPIQVPHRPEWAKKIAVHWIQDGLPLAYGDDDLIMTFSEALEMISIAPENCIEIRSAILAAKGRPQSEWPDIGQRCWMELNFHDNDPLPLWIHEKSYIPRAMNMDEM